MIVTPGDILAACQSLSLRIDAATQAIAAAPEVFDEAFRDAWNARSRRWLTVRAQCGDWASRWWNYKWGPILQDWQHNQAQWERQIEQRTGQPLPVPRHDPGADERPIEQWAKAKVETTIWVVLGALALGGVAVAVARTRR